jgi:hypothetical protein
MRMFDYSYIHPGFIFIPCPNMTPGGLRAQYLIPNLMPKCKCLSIYSSLPSVRTTSPRNPANPAQTVLLPNRNKLPTAGTSAESSEEILPCRTGFVTKLGPQISLFPVPIFGVNICPFNYGIKWFYSEINCKHQYLQVKSVQHLFFLLQSTGVPFRSKP